MNEEQLQEQRLAFRIHMEEMIRNDYVSLTLTIGEWKYEVVFKADNIAAITELIGKTMKKGFSVAKEEEYRAKNGAAQPGYG